MTLDINRCRVVQGNVGRASESNLDRIGIGGKTQIVWLEVRYEREDGVSFLLHNIGIPFI